MDVTKRKAAWLTSEYSRTNGSILRRVKALKVLKAKEARYLHLASLVTKKIATMEEELDSHRERAKTLAHVIELHDGGVPLTDAYVIRPHVRARVLGHGGLTRAIYRAFGQDLNRVLTIDELHDAIAVDTDTPAEDMRLLRDRLVVRVNIMRKLGKLCSLDPPLAPGRRWKLATELVLENPKPEPWGKPFRGEAGVRSAEWLIKAQLTLASSAKAAGEESPMTEKSATALAKTWAEHPLAFELDLERLISTPSRRQQLVCEEISRRIVNLGDWATLSQIMLHGGPLKYKQTVLSEKETRRLLRQLALVGRVEHRRAGYHYPMEWRARVG
ncbi:hypothetical protein CMZ82_00365 [Lysobacteraceae bacterium NML93-0792]|nr:hypothetical protein CMZ82_00365 [Xanthomonadaceae bacterium NML93-0792]PBS16537.1 hypothetical protein CMZ81_04615 [Xanthomonadaceae bacterium NML93-0793]PBS19912.1 hypothetical protein CMZ80_02670 [Xanthomonadaceae bacterium NML93-0831]